MAFTHDHRSKTLALTLSILALPALAASRTQGGPPRAPAEDPMPLPVGRPMAVRTPPPPHWEDPDRLRDKVAQMMSPQQYRRAMEATGMSAHLAGEFRSSGPGWVLEGPIGEFNDYNGRVSQIRITDAAGYTVYAGACSGGLWKFTYDDFVATGEFVWESIGDSLPNPSVRGFDIDPNDEDHIIVGTGEASRYVGGGMYSTPNGGVDWTYVPVALIDTDGVLVDPDWFSKVEFQPSSSTTLLAASSHGLLRSTDGGTVWTVVLGTTIIELGLERACYDFVWDPTDGSRSYAISRNSAGDGLNLVWRSTDAGATWDPLTPPPGGFSTFLGIPNARIAICRDQPATVVIVTALLGQIETVARTDNARAATPSNVTWTDITNLGDNQNPTKEGIGDMAFQALALAVRPDDPDKIYVGAMGIATTANNGANWHQSPLNFHHADHAVFGFFGSGAWDDVIWVGDDGGIYWDDLSVFLGPAHKVIGGPDTGLAISQVDYSDADRDVIAIGLQDNGVVKRGASTSPWDYVGGGDGMDVTFVDGQTGDIWYCSGLNPEDLDNDGSADRPWRIYREDWAADTDTGNPHPGPGKWGLRMFHDVWNSIMYAFAGVNVIAIDEGDINSGWVTAVPSPGAVQVDDIWGSEVDGKTLFVTYIPAPRSDDLGVCRRSGGTFTVTNLIDLGGTVVTVTPSYRWSAECWVGLASSPGGPKVLHILPNGASTDITGNLASLNIVHSIAVTPFHSDILYAATDIGVFRTTDGGEFWEPFMTNLPVVQCKELDWVPDDSGGTSHQLVVATYGRGVYRRTITAPTILYVNQDATGFEDGTFEHPYQTVAAAVAIAPPGAIIAIHADDYVEARMIIIKSLRLESWAGRAVIR